MSNPDDALAPRGWLELSPRAKLRLTGGDRVRFLNGQVSNDVRALRPGAALLACVMTAKGKMSADAFVRPWLGDALLVDAEPELREALAARLERYIIADDVLLEDVTDEWALLHTVGGWLPPEPAPPAFATAGSFLAFEAERLGRLGTDFFVSAASADSLRAWFAADGARALDAEEAERARIAAGVPRWGAELDEDTIPPEAGLEERAISYAKGCYIGQEVISRIKSVGRVNRRLCRLRSAEPLDVGDELRPAGELPEARPSGRVTSVARDGDAGWIALAFLRRPHDTLGGILFTPGGTRAEVW